MSNKAVNIIKSCSHIENQNSCLCRSCVGRCYANLCTSKVQSGGMCTDGVVESCSKYKPLNPPIKAPEDKPKSKRFLQAEVYTVRPVVCDYGIFEYDTLKLIVNSHANALLIAAIMNKDNHLSGNYYFSEKDFQEHLAEKRKARYE